MRRYLTIQDVIDAIRFYIGQIHLQENAWNFDRISERIFGLIEKLIFRCLGSIPNARKRMEAEGLEDYLDMYLDMCL